MEKHPLHLKNPELQKSNEVQDAVEKKERLDGKKLPNNPNERIDTYVDRLENIFLNSDDRVRTRNLEMLRNKIYDELIIKREDVPEEYFELQRRVARERGQAIEEISPEMRERMIDTIIEDQKQSLDNWIDYLTSDDAVYPAWYKYFVWKNIINLSQFDKSLGKFKKRTHTTTAPFPDIFREPLAQVCDVYEAVAKDNTKLKDPKVQEVFGRSFGNVYALKIQESLSLVIENRESIKGKWIKYEQGVEEDARRLYESLQGKGTGWCTAGQSTAETQIESGDFYVYYTDTDEEKAVQPRIAIRMDGKDHIAEVRGILEHQQLEPQMQEVLDEKLKEFGSEADTYRKKSLDMKRLTAIEHAMNDDKPLTRDDLLFLYEIDSAIEGFGYGKDPRIEELRSKRNRKEDIEKICDCPSEYIANDFFEITETTHVFCEDTGEKISFLDFREARNQVKLPQLIELAKKLKESGSPARPDMSFEGGIVSVDIDQEKIKDLPTALTSYENADNKSPSWIWPEWLKIKSYVPPSSRVDLIIFSYNADPQTRQSSDKIVADVDKLGLRPATIAELIALGIMKPEFNKREDGTYFVGLGTKEVLDGVPHVPYLRWEVRRRLSGVGWAFEWYDRSRFVCVRK